MKCRQGDVICHALQYLKNLNFFNYCRRKSYTQLSMDIALIVVNASHLTQVIRIGSHDSLYTVKICLISLSIFFEVAIGILLCFKERYDINNEGQHKIMNFLNDLVVWLIFFSVLLHVFVSVFVEHNHYPLHSAHYRMYPNCSATNN